ncbi:MAG: hypothetical protein GX587_08535 [Bacteroidales bacterium]|nr:hypothetical protein [Bacteroidales bacterium]
MKAKDTVTGAYQSRQEKRNNSGLKTYKEHSEKDVAKHVPSKRKETYYKEEYERWIKRFNSINSKLSTSNDLPGIQRVDREIKKSEQFLAGIIKANRNAQITKEQICFEEDAKQKLLLLKAENNKLIQNFFNTLKSRLQNSLETFENDSLWRESLNILPSYIRSENMAKFLSQVKKARILLDKESYEDLVNVYEELKKNNSERARKALSRRQLKPDKYIKDDSSQIKKQAKTTVLKAHPSAIIKRIHILDREWKETIQQNDKTNPSGYIKRREIMAQLAAELNNRSRLFTIYLHQEKKNDGNWRRIKGHILYSDPIKKKNINSPLSKESQT